MLKYNQSKLNDKLINKMTLNKIKSFTNYSILAVINMPITFKYNMIVINLSVF